MLSETLASHIADCSRGHRRGKGSQGESLQNPHGLDENVQDFGPADAMLPCELNENLILG